jgi:heme-binding protein
MLLNARLARRAVVCSFGALGAGVAAGAILTAAPLALAEPAPNCTAGDLAQVRAGVSAGTSAYLFTHPWVNDFFTSLQGRPRDQVRTQIQDYLAANPREQGEIQAIRQPLVDLRARCGIGINVNVPMD